MSFCLIVYRIIIFYLVNILYHPPHIIDIDSEKLQACRREEAVLAPSPRFSLLNFVIYSK
jgi:hypothetical protein